jgi:hypothetical protein
LVKVRVCAAAAFFSCLAVNTECVYWNGYRADRRHNFSDSQPDRHHRGFQCRTGSNRPAEQRTQRGKTVPRPGGTITFLDGSTSLSSAPIALVPNGIASATFPQTFGTPDPSLTAG